jgi:hypothetical protein
VKDGDEGLILFNILVLFVMRENSSQALLVPYTMSSL